MKYLERINDFAIPNLKCLNCGKKMDPINFHTDIGTMKNIYNYSHVCSLQLDAETLDNLPGIKVRDYK